MSKSPYSPADSKKCKDCGKVREKFRPKNPRNVNPYDASVPRSYCKCDK